MGEVSRPVVSAVRERPEGTPVEDALAARATDLRVLFDVSHPAQVHLFRNAIAELRRRGHETFVTSREKEVTVDLLEAYDIDHETLSVRGESLPALLAELLRRERRLLAVARRFEPDVIVSRLSPAAAHVSTIVGCPNVVISDTRTDGAVLRRLFGAVTLPFVDTICAPPAFDLAIDPGRREPLDFQELAYLHPRYFEPDRSALEAHGIDPDEPYYVIRLAGWDAYHDVGHEGLRPEATRELVSFLSDHGTVYVSVEGPVPDELADYRLPTPPELVHHVLSFADLYVGDSGTMSSEAAMLGTPAIRTNSMVGDGDEHAFRALEADYGLLRSFASSERAVAEAKRMVREGIDRRDWRRRRRRLLDDQPDVTARIVETVVRVATRED